MVGKFDEFENESFCKCLIVFKGFRNFLEGLIMEILCLNLSDIYMFVVDYFKFRLCER